MTFIDPYVVGTGRGRLGHRYRIHPANDIQPMLATRRHGDAAHRRLAVCPQIEARTSLLERIVSWLPGQHRPSPCVALSEDRAQT